MIRTIVFGGLYWGPLTLGDYRSHSYTGGSINWIGNSSGCYSSQQGRHVSGFDVLSCTKAYMNEPTNILATSICLSITSCS